MDDVAGREYAALRETIRARGGARPIVFLVGVVAWAAGVIGVLTWLSAPIASVVPLLVLLATFEAIRSLHLGVERIGRYIQVFYEEIAAQARGSAPTTPPAWEVTAMAFGPTLPGAGVHPYFLPVFLMATAVNFVSALLPQPVAVELAMLAVTHLAFVIWLVVCDRAMRRQRASELARFRALRAGSEAT